MSTPVVNYLIRMVSHQTGQYEFMVSLANAFWTGPFQVGSVYRDGVVVGQFTFYSGPTEILTFTVNGNEVYLFQNGVGCCASAGGEQGNCELIRC